MISRRAFVTTLAAGTALGLLGPIRFALANDAQEARAIVQNIADQGLNILSRPDRSERDREFLRLFTEYFNTTAIGRFVLGRYRDGVSPETFERYMDVFRELVAKTYTKQLGDFAGEQFRIVRTRVDGSRPVVESQIAPPGRSTIRLDWILSRGKEGLKVVDVRVDNLSMAITQRDEFTSVIQQNGGSIEKLIEFMQSKIRQIDQNA